MASISNLNKQQKIQYGLIATASSLIFYLYSKYIHVTLLSYISIKLHSYSTLYKKTYRPKKILIIRHGQSQTNTNLKIRNTIPDVDIQLTELGKTQAMDAGIKLNSILEKNSKIKFFVSPYLRTKETYNIIKSQLNIENFDIDYVEEPMIREIEVGNFTSETYPSEELRTKFGRFFFRFEMGESGADVYDRASMFLSSLYRNMDNYNRKKYDYYIIITHKFFISAFLMRFFRKNVSYFNEVNVKNCEIVSLKKNDDFSYVIEQ